MLPKLRDEKNQLSKKENLLFNPCFIPFKKKKEIKTKLSVYFISQGTMLNSKISHPQKVAQCEDMC